MRKNATLRRVSFCMDVARFYVLVFLLIYMGWLTQSGAIQPLGGMFSMF